MATKDGSPSPSIRKSEEIKDTQQPSFTCLYTNASSIKGNDKVDELITRFGNPDLIGISETGFDNDSHTANAEERLRNQLTDYNVFVCNIGEGRGRKSVDARGPQSRAGTWGGVAICVKNTALSSELVNFVNIPNPSYVDQVWCTVTIGGVKGLVGCIYQLVLKNKVYIANMKLANNEIMQAFTNAKNFVNENNLKFLLIMGDFNNPNLKWGVDSDCLKMPKTIQQRETSFMNGPMNGLQQFVKFPTYKSHKMLGFAIEKKTKNYEVTVLSKLTINDKYKNDNNINTNLNYNENNTFLNDHFYGYQVTAPIQTAPIQTAPIQSDSSFTIGRDDLIELIASLVKDSNGLDFNAANVLKNQFSIVGDFKDPNKTWPKKLEFDGQSIKVKRPKGNILDLLITNEGATIEQLEQYDPLGEKTGHSVLTFKCRINGDDAVENLTGYVKSLAL